MVSPVPFTWLLLIEKIDRQVEANSTSKVTRKVPCHTGLSQRPGGLCIKLQRYLATEARFPALTLASKSSYGKEVLSSSAAGKRNSCRGSKARLAGVKMEGEESYKTRLAKVKKEEEGLKADSPTDVTDSTATAERIRNRRSGQSGLKYSFSSGSGMPESVSVGNP